VSTAFPSIERRHDLAQRIALDAAQSIERAHIVVLGRSLVCVLLGAALAVAYATSAQPLPPWWLAGLLALAAAGFARLWRRLFARAPLEPTELLVTLLLDVLATAAVLELAGAGGHLLSLVLALPVAVAALALPRRQSLAVFGVTLAAATWMLLGTRPPEMTPGAWVLAPWVECALAAAFAVLFGARLADAMRLSRRRIAALARAHDPRTEALLGLATLAAGTAHEMGTPLSTIALLVGELRRERTPPADWQQSLEVLWQATQACRRSLQDMAAAVDRGLHDDDIQCAERLSHELVARFAHGRADGRAAPPIVRSRDLPPAPLVAAGATVRQAVLNLLDNAAEVSPDAVELAVAWTDRQVTLEVRDRGPGIAADIRERLGRSVVTTKADGRGNGIGVFLAAAAVARAGGRLHFLPREGGGTCARIELPATSGQPAGTAARAALAAHERTNTTTAGPTGPAAWLRGLATAGGGRLGSPPTTW
jgi:two-component system sensor histidine kinase RegB